MITSYKLYEMKNSDAQIEFYKKLSDPKIYNEIKKFVESEIEPYCKNPIVMSLFDDFKNFSSYNSTNIQNLKTTEYSKHFSPGKYSNDGYGANISYFIVEDKNTKNVVDSYFELKIFGFNYKEKSGKAYTEFKTEITDSNLKNILHLSKLTSNDKLEIYIDKIDIVILKNIANKKLSGFIDNIDSLSDYDIREELKFWLHEDYSYSDPLKTAIKREAKKLGILI